MMQKIQIAGDPHGKQTLTPKKRIRIAILIDWTVVDLTLLPKKDLNSPF
jgi:hypothetical protein